MSNKNEAAATEGADLQIGPTNLGMVRLIIIQNGRELNLDFDPEEADEIAEEIVIAAKKARASSK